MTFSGSLVKYYGDNPSDSGFFWFTCEVLRGQLLRQWLLLVHLWSTTGTTPQTVGSSGSLVKYYGDNPSDSDFFWFTCEVLRGQLLRQWVLLVHLWSTTGTTPPTVTFSGSLVKYYGDNSSDSGFFWFTCEVLRGQPLRQWVLLVHLWSTTGTTPPIVASSGSLVKYYGDNSSDSGFFWFTCEVLRGQLLRQWLFLVHLWSTTGTTPQTVTFSGSLVKYYGDNSSDSGFFWFTCEVLRGQLLRQWVLLVHLWSTTGTTPPIVASSGSLVKYYGDNSSDSGFFWFTCEVLRGQLLRQWLFLVHLWSTTGTTPPIVASSGSLVKYYGDNSSDSGFFWFTCEVLREQFFRQWLLLVHLWSTTGTTPPIVASSGSLVKYYGNNPSDSGFFWFTCEVLRGQLLRQWVLLVHLWSTTGTTPPTVGSSGSLVKYYGDNSSDSGFFWFTCEDYGDNSSDSGFFWFTCEVLRGQLLR